MTVKAEVCVCGHRVAALEVRCAELEETVARLARLLGEVAQVLHDAGPGEITARRGDLGRRARHLRAVE